MVVFKKSFLFFLDQLAQVRAGGHRVFYRKCKKAVRLLFMNIVAPIAVYLEMDWPEAYDFLLNQSFRKIKKLRSQSSTDILLMNKLLEQSILYLKKNTERSPDLSNLRDWMQRSLRLGNLYIMKNDDIRCTDVFKRTAEVQRQIIKKHQLDTLEIEFIPRVLPQGSIGAYENLEVYIKAGMLGLRPNKKTVLLLDQNTPINNPCYLKYWSKYVTIISDPFLIEMLAPLETYLTTPFISYMHFYEKFYRSSFVYGVVREEWVEEDRPLILKLSDEDYERGWNCLRSLGVPQDAWFVILHVRGSGWKDGGSQEESFRNADISTYIPAIKAITDAGGWVLRIGDRKMSKLPAMPQVIDYAHSQAKSDWMDVFLCAQCRFMIGTSSGMCVVATAFGAPLVMTNMLPGYAVYQFTSKDLLIPRLCFSKDQKRYLNFNELISPPVGTATSQSHFDNRNIQVIENKPEEIKVLVEEMLEKCDGTLKYSEEDEILQKRFKEITASCGEFYGDFNLISHVRIGRKFLREHKDLLQADLGIKEECQLLSQ